MRLGRRTAVLLLGSVLSSCADSEPTSQTTTVRDSAGIRIVENAAPAWGDGEAWTISTEPVQTFGNREGEPLLSQVGGGARLSDGRVVVIESFEQSLLFYDSSGAFEAASGRRGDGPEEFQQVMGLAVSTRDTVHVFDARTRRANILSSQGQFVREVALDNNGRVPFTFAPEPIANSEDLLWTPISSASIPNLEAGWRTIPILRTDATGSAVDTILTLPFENVEYEGGSRIFVRYAPSGVYAWTSNRILSGISDEPQLHHYDLDGNLRAIYRWQADRISIDQGIRDRLLEASLESFRENPGLYENMTEEIMIERSRDARYASALPVMQRVRLDDVGNSWVREYPLLDLQTGRIWHVIDGDGMWLGSVEMPEALSILEIGDDYILGAIRDDFDVPTVVLHRILKP